MRRFLVITALFLTGCIPPQGNNQQASSSASGAASSVATGTGTEIPFDAPLPDTLELGDTEADVRMTIFTNHACAYCKDFQRSIMPRLMDEFVRDGSVHVTVVPFALNKYPSSDRAALLQVCAVQQGKGLEMNDVLFTHTIDSPAFRTQLTTFGIDEAALQACTASAEARSAVDAQKALAQSHNVTVVPTYVIDDTIFTGLPEYADLRGQIREAMGNK